MKTVFVVCQHGDEKLPLVEIQNYRDKLRYLIANEMALKKGVRFVEADLNRVFPGQIKGNIEERIAAKLIKKLDKYDEVVDLHTATCETPLFAIITKVTKRNINLARKLGIKKIVYMRKSIASGRALIDYVRHGISVECGNEKSVKTKKEIRTILDHFIENKVMVGKIEVYVVYKILKRTKQRNRLPSEVENFRITKLDGEAFYPVLARETNYKGVLCLMAKKINEDGLLDSNGLKSNI